MVIGVNLPWFGGAYGHDLGRNQAYPDWPVWYDSGRVDEILGFLSTSGIRLVRIWLFEEGEGLEQELRVDDLFLGNLGDLARRIRSAGMQVYWTLFDANATRRQFDRITASILTEPAAAEEFTSHALSAIAPIIQDVAWAIDLCNEPEAIGKWSKVGAPLRILREGVANFLPGARVSLGSGHRNHHHIRRLDLSLDFFDLHYYVEQALACPRAERFETPVVLGEFGCLVNEQDRSSEQAWATAQARLAESLAELPGLGYEAAFLWYLNTPESEDATALVFRGQVGAALGSIQKRSAGINRHVGVSSEGWRIQWEAVPPGQQSGAL
jgi:hypothetical protein